MKIDIFRFENVYFKLVACENKSREIPRNTQRNPRVSRNLGRETWCFLIDNNKTVQNLRSSLQ